jgi:spore coat protein E
MLYKKKGEKSMSEYREILAKAVVGRGNKNYITNHKIEADKEVSKTLGCWIINHQYIPYIVNESEVKIEGSYDVHIWYAYDKDLETSLVKKTINYKETLPFKMKPGERIGINNELKGFMVKYPTCINMTLENNDIYITVEKEFTIDAIGETKLKVQVSKTADESWLLETEIDQAINPNYIIENPTNTIN